MTARAKAKRPRVASRLAPYERRRLTLTLTAAQRDALDVLLATGLWGFTRVDVLRRLIDAKLVELAERAWIPVGPAAPTMVIEGRAHR